MNVDPSPNGAGDRQADSGIGSNINRKLEGGDTNSVERLDETRPSSLEQVSAMGTTDQADAGANDDDTEGALNLSGSNGAGNKSTSRKGSFQSSRRNSSSFLSKFQSSTSSTSSATNNESSSTKLPSSLANAFSSLTSSFASSFTVNNLTNGSTNRNHQSGSNINNSISENVASNLTIETVSTSTGISVQSHETRDQILAKKSILERKNLINLTKLIVKDLISSSLSTGRTIDENHSAIHLRNYFTLIDRVLKHGLKQNILSSRSASLWNALDNLPKYLTDKRLTSETVRSLAHTRTPDGRIRAWLRIAMMQKKLPEYFSELLANKEALLSDVYYDYAFMMNDEAHVFAGLIIGVNVIDCNFFVKDDNFDSMEEVIDLSPYLKAANSFEEDEKQDAINMSGISTDGDRDENLAAVLDQKNYLEERSKHLESTAASLQARIKQLEEQNSRLEIDAKVNEVRIQKLMRGEAPGEKSLLAGGFPIPNALMGLMNPTSNDSKTKDQTSTKESEPHSLSADSQPNAQTIQTSAPSELHNNPVESTAQSGVASDRPSTPVSTGNVPDTNQAEHQQLMAELERYRKLSSAQEEELNGLRERVGILEGSYRSALGKIRALERDLDVQTSMNKDKETTIKIQEKDLRVKQIQVESLRVSLADTKKMTADLNERLSEADAKLKERLSSITNLQTSLDKWKIENKNLATRLQDKQVALKSVTSELEKVMRNVDDLKKYNEKINDDLRRERECGQSCSNTLETQTAKINELTERLRAVESELDELRANRDKLEELKRRNQDYELSLEEVGNQLREARLELESLRENSSMFLDSQWMDSKQVKDCALCQQAFSVTRRKHHCRLCGNVFCQTCSDNKMELASSSKPARVCDTCHAFLLAKFVKSSSSS